MAIKRIKVSNFKSFRELDLELGKLNILIGANASGKSNFIQILKFLRDIANFGLEEAVSMQGGIGYLRNLQASKRDIISIEVVWDHRDELLYFPLSKPGSVFVGKSREARYRFGIEPTGRDPGFHVTHDEVTLWFDLFRLERMPQDRDNGAGSKVLSQGTITFSNRRGCLKEEIQLPESSPLRGTDLGSVFAESARERIPPRELLLHCAPRLFRASPFQDTRIFDFDPKLPKKAVPFTGRTQLEEDGSNVALALRSALASQKTRRMITNLLHDMLPFVVSLDVKPLTDKSLIFRVRETYAKKHPLPAAFVSDGTICLAELLLALYFQESPVIVIEEPERNIHPHLISRVVTWMEEASAQRQILVTTHNPQLIKHADLESVLLVSRDRDGFSNISRPAEREDVKIFLQNEIGIDDLFVQNMLETPA